MATIEIDPNFEPQTRVRSNTWPLPRPEDYVEKVSDDPLQLDSPIKPDSGQIVKKNTSRRNAWGNMSYADLITQAIISSPEKRLTLSQIYDWMVQNVPFFKDKGDSNSSAGWKNSIRHNLSLHNRFIRVQNEGTGKSSWWMINPDAKPGKSTRRRATSMETHKYEKRRGRVKKKVEQLRTAGSSGTLDGRPGTPHSSSPSEGGDMFPDSPLHSFQLSDFRSRTNSNASSCGGHLSPIPAIETDMHDNEVPPMSPLWHSEFGSTSNLSSPYSNGNMDRFGTDQLVDTLAESMKLSMDNSFNPQPTMQHILQQTATNGYSLGQTQVYSDYNSFAQHSPQPNGSDSKLASLRHSPQHPLQDSYSLNNGISNGYVPLPNVQSLSPAHSVHSLSPAPSMENPHSAQDGLCQQDSLLSQDPMMTSINQSAYTCRNYGALNHQPPAPPQQQQQPQQIPTRPAHINNMVNNSMLRAALTQRHLTAMAQQCMQSQLVIPDVDLTTVQGGLDCDLEQILKHEIALEGSLDFNDVKNGFNWVR